MRVAVLSDARLPTLPDGGHGLGMSAHAIATGLAERDHDVMLFAGNGSQFSAGILVTGLSERELAREAAPGRFDAFLDTSHQHHLSRMDASLPVLNRMADLECNWRPPNVVVNSPFMQTRFGGRLVNTGVDVESIPFTKAPGDYVAFASTKVRHKGWPKAREIARATGRELHVIDGLEGPEKWQALGGAYALLHPSTIDAAPRVPLEAAACGVPTLCLGGDGAAHHVNHGVSGFVCADVHELADALHSCRVSALDRRKVREWVVAEHGFEQMVDEYEHLLGAIEAGERW